MQQQKNSFIFFIMLIQFFSLFSSQEYRQLNNNRLHDAPHVQMNCDNHQADRPFGHCYVSIQPGWSNNYPAPISTRSIIADCGSLALNKHFDAVIAPMFCQAAVKNNYCAVPGYVSPHGLRDCFVQNSQFPLLDKAFVAKLNTRLESYCTRIEKVLFDRGGIVRETISFDNQTSLATIYADFLKEFYFDTAKDMFEQHAQGNPVMDNVMRGVNWDCIESWMFDGKDSSSSAKKIEQRYAGAVNGNLGAVYKALETGDIQKAYTLGHERIKTVVSRWLGSKKNVNIISVFEQYPDLYKIVEHAYQIDKAKIEQEIIAQQTAMKQVVGMLHKEYTVYARYPEWNALCGDLLQRCDAAARDMVGVRLYKKVHSVLSENKSSIDSQLLTADQKGIVIFGGHLQHHLADEALTVVDTLISGDLTGTAHDAVLDLANASLISNKDGDILTASRTLDACWMILDFTQRAARYTHRSLPPVVVGMIEGVGESLHGAAHVVCHPVEAAQDLVNSFVTMGYYLGKLTYSIADFSTACDMVEMQPERVEQMIKEYSCDPTVFFTAYEQAQNISSKDVARVGTKTVVDMMLLHGATKIVSAITKHSLPAFLSCMRKGGQSADVAITAEGVPVRCAEEVSSLMGNNVEKVGGGVIAEVLVDSRMLIDNMANKLLQDIKLEIVELKKKFDCVQNCVVDCTKKGFAEFNNKHIKIPYEHILGIELKWNDLKNTLSGVSGFHHDFMGIIENSGLLKFVRKGVEKNGCYLADILLDGARVPGKTFFPQHWSREKVISKIYEAYESFIKSGVIPLEKGGKYIIEGLTQEGINIRMFITKNGQVATAYPIVKPGI